MFRKIIEWIRLRRKIENDTRHLKALDDYMLADLGIQRDQIELFVRGKVLTVKRQPYGAWKPVRTRGPQLGSLLSSNG